MTAKNFVQNKFPKAAAERQVQGDNTVYWLIRDGRAYFYMAQGKTQAEAWKNAKKKIQEQEKKELV